MTVLPAFVDPHVHLRTPGQEYKEDLATGTAAAAAGGYCAILAMPNTDPVIDSLPVLESLFERGGGGLRWSRPGSCRPSRVGLQGGQLTEMHALAERGAAGFTDDGRPVERAGLLRRAFQYVAPLGLPLALHEEDLSLSRGGVDARGHRLGRARHRRLPVDRRVGDGGARPAHRPLRGRPHPPAAPVDARVDRGGAPGRASVGVRVSAEASPHHLLLTDEAVRSLDANVKMNPPLAAEPTARR